MSRVVGLGGGHGLAVTLTAARRYATQLTAVVSVADDGGSSGRLRRDLGISAPGDVRRCLVALAAHPDSVWPRAFAGRFDRGDLAGHALGNLVLAGLTQATGSFERAIEEAGRLLDVCGRVLPATVEPATLTTTVEGRHYEGQTAIEAISGGLSEIGFLPRDVKAPVRVIEAIRDADQVILGPGSLFTSVIAVAAVPKIRDALADHDNVVYVCNLKASKETVGFDAAAHVEALHRHGIKPGVVVVDPSAIEVGEVPIGTKAQTHPLARPNGWNHDVDLLAPALAALVGG